MNHKPYIELLNKKLNLPEQDPNKALQDWHTVNAVSFHPEGLLEKVLPIKEAVEIGKVYPECPEQDKHKIFKNGYLAIRKYFRDNSKAPGLGLMYGGSSGLLEKAFGVTKAQGIRMFASFFRTLVVLKQHLEDRKVQAIADGYVETLLGARLYLPQLKDPKTKNQGIRKVFNSPIQGSASNLIHIFILKVGEYIEEHTLSKLQGNNITKIINGTYYNRIVTIRGLSKFKIRLLNKELDNQPNGHTRLIILDNKNNPVQVYDRAVKINYDLFSKYNMKIYH